MRDGGSTLEEPAKQWTLLQRSWTGRDRRVHARVLEELLNSRVWHAEGLLLPAAINFVQPPNAAVGMAAASIAAPQGSMSSIGRQQATLLERESLLQVVGSAFDLLTVAVAASTDDAVSDDSAGAGGTVDIGSRAAVQVALRRMLSPCSSGLRRLSRLSSASELTLCRICASRRRRPCGIRYRAARDQRRLPTRCARGSAAAGGQRCYPHTARCTGGLE